MVIFAPKKGQIMSGIIKQNNQREGIYVTLEFGEVFIPKENLYKGTQ
jgi:DNA-directed RNA polymerase subunit E'/Rpb7